jgi:tRNA (uracil-5-)-methyltransferase
MDPQEACITNAGSFLKEQQLRRILTEGGVKGMVGLHKLTMAQAAFVYFESEAACIEGMATINKISAKGRIFTAKPSTVVNGVPKSKRGEQSGESAPAVKRPRLEDAATGAGGAAAAVPVKALNDVITPWHAVPYPVQLERKQAEMAMVMRAVTARLAAHTLRNVKDLPPVFAKRVKSFAKFTAAQLAEADEEGKTADGKAGLGKRNRAVFEGSAGAAGAVSSSSSGAAVPPASADETTGAGSSIDTLACGEAAEAAAPGTADAASAVAAGSAQAGLSSSSAAGAAGVVESEGAKSRKIWPIDVPSTHAALLPSWLLPNLTLQLPACPLRTIKHAPQQSGFRNKASFTLGRDASGKPCAGHRVASYLQTTLVAAPDESCLSYRREVVQLMRRINDEFLASSPLPVFDLVAKHGVWKTLTIRHSDRTGEVMVILLAAPPGAAAQAAAAPESGAAAEGDVAADVDNAPAECAAAAAEETAPPPASDAAAAAPPATEDAASAAAGPTADLASVYKAELQRFVELCTSWTPTATAAAEAVSHTDAAAASASDLSANGAGGAGPGATPSPAPVFRVVSVMLQEFGGSSSMPPPNHPHTLLAGQAHYTELLCGLRFRVSPGAFFQVNTPGAEVLYSLVRDLAARGVLAAPPEATAAATAAAAAEHPAVAEAAAAPSSGVAVVAAEAAAADTSPESLAASASSAAAPAPALAVAPAATSVARTDDGRAALVDVCCGTGTIGLACAADFSRIVGVELSAEAIEDARVNAALNGVPNALFFCEKAENVMRDVLDRACAPIPAAAGAGADASSGQITRFVAVVDPPRGGLHPSVIKALRTCRPLKRIVYVSCNPTGTFIEDAVKLCAPQEGSSAVLRGPNFRPVVAVPVDMFPHTPHTELVCLLDRD